MAARPPQMWRRLLWFAGLWLGGVLTVGAISMLIRTWLL